MAARKGRGPIDERLQDLFAKDSFSRQLINLDKAFQALLRAKLEERGYPQFKPSFAALIANMPLDGCRLSDVVESIGFSKQAVSKIALEAEKQGYIQIVPDRRDARAKHLIHTDRGLNLVKDALELGREAEADIARMIGAKKMRQFKAVLRDLNLKLQ